MRVTERRLVELVDVVGRHWFLSLDARQAMGLSSSKFGAFLRWGRAEGLLEREAIPEEQVVEQPGPRGGRAHHRFRYRVTEAGMWRDWMIRQLLKEEPCR